MIRQRVRKVGNSLVITIPKDEAAKLDINEGDFIDVDLHPLDIRPAMRPEIRAAAERSWQKSERAYRYLADR